MNKKALNLVILFLFCVSAGAVTVRAATFDKIIVVVNGETITQAELNAALGSTLEKIGQKGDGTDPEKLREKYKKEILDKMIEEKLILSEAKNKELKIEDSEVEQRLKDVEGQFGSEEKFNAALNDENLSINDLKKKYTDQIRISKIVEYEVRKKVTVAPDELLKYFDSHKEEFRQSPQVKLKTILFKPAEGQNDEDLKTLAGEVLQTLKAGGNFDELALKYSKGPNPESGGEIGLVKKGDLLKVIDDAVFNLPEGALSDVIKTPAGYYIFKVVEIKPERVKDFKEVKNEIEKSLSMAKMKKRYDQWISELKKNAYISYR